MMFLTNFFLCFRSPTSETTRNKSLFFRDGVRSVDFVLVWENTNVCIRDHGMKRNVFERALRHEGLHIERDAPHGGLNFVKVRCKTFSIFIKYL